MRMGEKNKGNLYILITAILWSTGGLFIKYVPGHPVAINGLRSLVALIFFCLYRRTVKIKWNKLIVSAALCLVLTNTLFVVANKLTTAANAIILEYTAPIFVLIWDCIYRRKAPKKKQCLVVLMAFSGMILFFFDRLQGGQLLGNLVAICAGLTFSGVFFINSLPEASSPDSSMLAFFLSFLISIPFLGDVHMLDTVAVLALLGLGIFQVGLAYVLFAKGTKLTSPVSASLIGLMEAILNPIWVYLVFGEAIGKYALAGSGIILLAVVLNTIWSAKEA